MALVFCCAHELSVECENVHVFSMREAETHYNVKNK